MAGRAEREGGHMIMERLLIFIKGVLFLFFFNSMGIKASGKSTFLYIKRTASKKGVIIPTPASAK